MYGFLVTRGVAPKASPFQNGREISCGDVHFYYDPMPKFENDKLFFEDEERIVLLDGVVFNNHELMAECGSSVWKDAFLKKIQCSYRTLMKDLRGSFIGILYEKATGTLLAFTNQSGERAVYYSQQSDFFVIASHSELLLPVLREQGIVVAPNLQSCRELLLVASVLQGRTPFEGVFRLVGGKYLLQTEAGCEEQRYHFFENTPDESMSEEYCIEELDKRFRHIVDLICRKNQEYGYHNEFDLSGGLDSRMSAWVAHDLGYGNATNVCYSQSGGWEQRVSSKIAKELGNEYLFLPMDDGAFIYDVEESVSILGGQISYILPTGARRAMQRLSEKHELGVMTTGLSGGILRECHEDAVSERYPAHQYVNLLSLDVPNIHRGYHSLTQQCFYEVDAPLFLLSVLLRRPFGEAVSPFVDPDYLEFVFRTPGKFRKDGYIFRTWMERKYPRAAAHIWLAKQMPVSYYNSKRVYWPKVASSIAEYMIRAVNKGCRVLHLPLQLPVRTDMNPFDLWYRTNPKLRTFIGTYYSENLNRVKDDSLREDLVHVFTKGGARDKLQVLNLLAVYKLYF